MALATVAGKSRQQRAVEIPDRAKSQMREMAELTG
jgi:transcriptional regulator of met regulon